MTTRLRLAVIVGTALALAVVLNALAPRVHAAGDCWAVGWRCQTINAYRAASADRPPLDQARTLQDTAGTWARQIAATGTLSHSPAAGTDYAEAVGVAPDWATMLAAWDQSPEHRRILLGDYARVGLGCTRAGDLPWCAVQLD